MKGLIDNIPFTITNNKSIIMFVVIIFHSKHPPIPLHVKMV